MSVSADRWTPGVDDALLVELRHRGFTLYRWGPADNPALLAASFAWSANATLHDTVNDVVQLYPSGRALAYRAPHDEELFDPTRVHWEYHAPTRCARWCLRALFKLPAPTRDMPTHTPFGRCAPPDGLPSPLVMRLLH